nr:MAG TPA: NADH-ubiquinone oxidoreductase [Caudoviricetes sp.]
MKVCAPCKEKIRSLSTKFRKMPLLLRTMSV